MIVIHRLERSLVWDRALASLSSDSAYPVLAANPSSEDGQHPLFDTSYPVMGMVSQ